MTKVDLRLLNNDDSDSLIGEGRVWNAADGVTSIDKDLNFPIGHLDPSGSKVKVVVRDLLTLVQMHVYLSLQLPLIMVMRVRFN